MTTPKAPEQAPVAPAPKAEEPPAWFKAHAEMTTRALASLEGKVNGFKGYVDQTLKLRQPAAAEGAPKAEPPFQDDFGDNEQLRTLAARVAAMEDAPLVPKRQALATAFGGSADDYKGLNGDRMDAMLAKVAAPAPAGAGGTNGAGADGKPKATPTAPLDGSQGRSSLDGEGSNLLSENWLRKQAEADRNEALTKR